QLDKYRGKKIKYETLRAYLIITQLNVKEELSVPQAIRKAGSEMKIGVVLPGTYYKWRSNHREAYSLLCDGLNKGMSETEIIDCIRPFS
ncbi:MAG: hypothetical protein O6940_10365, partial [Ignavibacteria bacterium]|nr:hypothetical protein [Ignavibacteria bacterium]